MKKMVMMGLIVPLALLVAFASVSMAADEPAKQELNQDLNKDLNGDAGKDARGTQGRDVSGLAPVLDPGLDAEEAELNNTNSREASSLAAKRGRQPRRGSTAQVVADQQEYWGDNASGNDDEGNDEDEEPDGSPTSN